MIKIIISCTCVLNSFLMKNTISYWKLSNTFVWTPAEVLWKIHKSNSISPSYSQYVSQSWTISDCDIQYIQYNIMCGEDNAFASNFVVVAKVLHKPTWPLPPPPPTKIHLLITLLRNSVTSSFDMSHQPDDMTWLWHHYLSDSILFRFEPIIYCPAMFLLSYII